MQVLTVFFLTYKHCLCYYFFMTREEKIEKTGLAGLFDELLLLFKVENFKNRIKEHMTARVDGLYSDLDRKLDQDGKTLLCKYSQELDKVYAEVFEQTKNELVCVGMNIGSEMQRAMERIDDCDKTIR